MCQLTTDPCTPSVSFKWINSKLLQQNYAYLSLSLGGPEELGGGGPVASGLPTGKPAPKLVIWMGPCYEQKNTQAWLAEILN